MEFTSVEMGNALRCLMDRLGNLHHARGEFYAAYRKLHEVVRDEELLAAEQFVRFNREAEALEAAMIQMQGRLQEVMERMYRETPPLPPENL